MEGRFYDKSCCKITTQSVSAPCFIEKDNYLSSYYLAQIHVSNLDVFSTSGISQRGFLVQQKFFHKLLKISLKTQDELICTLLLGFPKAPISAYLSVPCLMCPILWSYKTRFKCSENVSWSFWCRWCSPAWEFAQQKQGVWPTLTDYITSTAALCFPTARYERRNKFMQKGAQWSLSEF